VLRAPTWLARSRPPTPRGIAFALRYAPFLRYKCIDALPTYRRFVFCTSAQSPASPQAVAGSDRSRGAHPQSDSTQLRRRSPPRHHNHREQPCGTPMRACRPTSNVADGGYAHVRPGIVHMQGGEEHKKSPLHYQCRPAMVLRSCPEGYTEHSVRAHPPPCVSRSEAGGLVDPPPPNRRQPQVVSPGDTVHHSWCSETRTYRWSMLSVSIRASFDLAFMAGFRLLQIGRSTRRRNPQSRRIRVVRFTKADLTIEIITTSVGTPCFDCSVRRPASPTMIEHQILLPALDIAAFALHHGWLYTY